MPLIPDPVSRNVVCISYGFRKGKLVWVDRPRPREELGGEIPIWGSRHGREHGRWRKGQRGRCKEKARAKRSARRVQGFRQTGFAAAAVRVLVRARVCVIVYNHIGQNVPWAETTPGVQRRKQVRCWRVERCSSTSPSSFGGVRRRGI
jgi:hypothetical protein